MYHCRIRFYLTGHPGRAADLIKGMAPQENFTYGFTESEVPERELASVADVIFLGLEGMDEAEAARALQTLASGMSGRAGLIVLAEKRQFGLLTDWLSGIKDVWIMPETEEELSFRIRRLQESWKFWCDSWQTAQYLEATINHVPNLIWYKDRNGIHEKVNDSFCRTVNKTREQVEGRGHAYIWDVEQDDPACIESENEVMEKRKTCVSDELITTGAGMRTLMTYKSPLYDMDGSVMGTVGVAIDVTKERAYEKEIVRKNQALETLFTTLDCGVMRHTLDGSRVLRVNRAALQILGYDSAEELMNAGFDMVAESVLDEDKPKLRRCISSLKKEGESIGVEYRVRHKDGELLHVMGNVRLLKENGELIYQRFLLDCTHQKLEEKKKERQQLELIRALTVDYSLVCHFDLDTGDGSVLRNDDENGSMFGTVFRDGMIFDGTMERYIQEFVHEEDREFLRQTLSPERLREELSAKKLLCLNYRTMTDGVMKYFQLKAVRAGTWEKGHRVVLGIHSVDEETRSEMEKKSILEDALFQANEASRAKSAFLSNMSHDIRTPMNAIVGFTSLAIAHIDEKEQVTEYLSKIISSGNHLLNLINDVLDMSRIESGRIHLEEKPCALPELVGELYNIVQADVNAKHQRLSIDIDIRNENVLCDVLRLNQVLLNLLGNAVKYTPEGGEIRLELAEEPGASAGTGKYVFCVSDNGIGMSGEFLGHIFEPFEREKNVTASGIQGTGLGMAITKNIVDMMNGTIEVESEAGRGSRFIVRLTFLLNQEPDTVQEDSGGLKIASCRLNRQHSGRILLAEDIEINQEIAVAILDDAGFTTEVAENGEVAVRMLAGSEPGYYQVILMDVQMPVLNGYEATRRIREMENPELASIPIIAMTANAFEEDRQEALRCGMNGHIAKPIDIAKLIETLDGILA